mgnify:CR=1 FL=1
MQILSCIIIPIFDLRKIIITVCFNSRNCRTHKYYNCNSSTYIFFKFFHRIFVVANIVQWSFRFLQPFCLKKHLFLQESILYSLCLQIFFKNLTVYKSNLVNLIHCFGFLRQLLEFCQSNAVKLCPFLIAYKFLCYFLCFLYIFTCISHTRHLLFLHEKAANLFFID